MKFKHYYIIALLYYIHSTTFAQLQLSCHYGYGLSTQSVKNTNPIGGGSFITQKESGIILSNKLSKYKPYYDFGIKYFFKKSYAANICINNFSVQNRAYYRSATTPAFYIDPVNCNSIQSISASISKDYKFGYKINVIPEVGVGVMNSYDETEFSEVIPLISSGPITFPINGFTNSISQTNKWFIPVNLNISFPIVDRINFNLKAGYQLNFSGYNSKYNIVYSHRNFPNETGLASYQLKNFYFLALGFSCQIFNFGVKNDGTEDIKPVRKPKRSAATRMVKE
jgi:hypothetical protein